MKSYYIVNNSTSKFVGAYTIEQIAARLETGEIQGDYLATESTGPSFNQLMESGEAVWIPVSQLLVNEPAASPITPATKSASSLPPIEGSGVATALTIFAILEFVGAVIGGFAVGSGDNGSPRLGFLIFISGVLGGCILLGFARVIEHTNESAQRLKRIEMIFLRSQSEKELSNTDTPTN